MKKQYLNTLCGVAFTLLGTMAAQAYDFEVDGIYYNVTNEEMKEVEVTYRDYDYNSYSGDVVIPDSVYDAGKRYPVTAIGRRAFSNCSGLTSVTIPDGVTSIGSNTFSNCSNLTSVTIPDGVTSIGSNTFLGCSSLTSVTIPDGVTSIGDDAFYNCSSLTSVNIPDGVTSIGRGAFSGCRSLTSVNIPDGVTSIGDYTFRYCSSLVSVTIGEGVTSIGECAFEDCNSLSSVVWNALNCEDFASDNTPFYDKRYFDARGKITAFTLGDSVKHVPAYLCAGMENLASVTFRGSTSSIGSDAFKDCDKLITMRYDGSLADWCRIDFATSASNPMGYADRIFIDRQLVQGALNIPNEVTEIKNYAFYNYHSLDSLTIPDGITSIGTCAFYGCNNLTSVTWNAMNCGDFTSHNTPFYYYEYDNDNYFDLRRQITSFTFGDSVQHIPAYLCAEMTELTAITMPQGVTSIGGYAFDACSELETMQFDGTLESWCRIDFATVASNPMMYADKGFINQQQLAGELIIPDGLTEVKDYVFYGCADLTTVVIPDEAKSIGSNAFSNCSSLASATIGDGVASIGNSAFYNCSSLTSVIIPDKVASIGDNAFEGCNSMTSAMIGKGVESIGSSAFEDCSSLTSITIPDKVTSIGSSAFSGCSSLVSATIGDGVTSIGDSTFYNCSSMASVTIGESMTSIGMETFYGCDSLASVTWKPIKYQNFTSYNTPFYYGGSNDDYNNFDLRTHITSFTFGDKVQHIPAWLCAGMSKLTAISLPNSVTSIGTSAFADCPAVKDLYSHALMPPVLAGDPSSWEGHPFAGLLESANLYVPCGTEFDYFTYSYWAVFKNIIGVEHQVLVMVDDGSKGTAALTQPVLCETSEAVIAATPNADYVFTQWSDGNTDNPRTVTVTSDTLFTALFAPAVCQVNLNTNDPFMGNVTGGGEYAYGTSATIEAVPAEGYRFVQWSDGNTDNPRTVVVTDNLTLTAEFESKEVTGLDDVTRQQAVTTDHRNILVYGAMNNIVSVYTVQGTCLYHGTAETEPIVIPVPSAGMYVVMAGEEMVKVVVR